MKKLGGIAALLFIGMFCITSCNEEIEPAEISYDVIERNSELFDLIESVLQHGDEPVENAVCIDFVYPFKLFIFDSEGLPTGSVILHGDDEFTQFLGDLSPSETIGISYPIETTLPDGSVFSVNNDDQLKVALESCSREDIIRYCSGILRNNVTCLWSLSYDQNQDSEFAESVFKANGDGSISLHHRNTDYIGTWIFLYVDNRLHLNIHLNDNNYVTHKWNYDYVVDVLDATTLQITSSAGTRTFTKKCSDPTVYAVGDTGPGGGLIAYDKGEYTNGWRYIEVATSDLPIEEWGCDQSAITAARYDAIGTGYQNTIANLQFHDNLNNYYTNPIICGANNNGTLTSLTALEQVINTTETDWFIPSIAELEIIRTNLVPLNLGNFDSGLYWSSSEFTNTMAKCLNFTDGQRMNILKNDGTIKTRIIRYL